MKLGAILIGGGKQEEMWRVTHLVSPPSRTSLGHILKSNKYCTWYWRSSTVLGVLKHCFKTHLHYVLTGHVTMGNLLNFSWVSLLFYKNGIRPTYLLCTELLGGLNEKRPGTQNTLNKHESLSSALSLLFYNYGDMYKEVCDTGYRGMDRQKRNN